MTYQCPLFTGNVLKVCLSCVKPSEKNGGEISKKNHGNGKKNQDRGRIYTPAICLNKQKTQDVLKLFDDSLLILDVIHWRVKLAVVFEHTHALLYLHPEKNKDLSMLSSKYKKLVQTKIFTSAFLIQIRHLLQDFHKI